MGSNSSNTSQLEERITITVPGWLLDDKYLPCNMVQEAYCHSECKYDLDDSESDILPVSSDADPEYDLDGPAVDLFSECSDEDEGGWFHSDLTDWECDEEDEAPNFSSASATPPPCTRKYCRPARRANGRGASDSNSNHSEEKHFDLEDQLFGVRHLNLSSDLTKAVNWRVFSSVFNNALAGISYNGIYLDNVIKNSSTGKEPPSPGPDGDGHECHAAECAFHKWCSANQLAHSCIKARIPMELHEVADQHPRACDLWKYLVSSQVTSQLHQQSMSSRVSHQMRHIRCSNQWSLSPLLKLQDHMPNISCLYPKHSLIWQQFLKEYLYHHLCQMA